MIKILKYDEEKDNLTLTYDSKTNSYIYLYNNEKVPITKLNRKTYYKLLEANLKLVSERLLEEKKIKRAA